tara:strand:+ start:281 stop:769 length:489 start_codon:yes stop_codon:yes gene_type:complete
MSTCYTVFINKDGIGDYKTGHVVDCEVDGIVIRELWLMNKQLIHREDGPAATEYDADGFITSKTWYKYGEKHRDGKPAEIRYHKRKGVTMKKWYKDGNLHREDGPAYMSYDSMGLPKYARFYINGEEVEDFTAPLTKSALKNDPLLLRRNSTFSQYTLMNFT